MQKMELLKASQVAGMSLLAPLISSGLPGCATAGSGDTSLRNIGQLFLETCSISESTHTEDIQSDGKNSPDPAQVHCVPQQFGCDWFSFVCFSTPQASPSPARSLSKPKCG